LKTISSRIDFKFQTATSNLVRLTATYVVGVEVFFSSLFLSKVVLLLFHWGVAFITAEASLKAIRAALEVVKVRSKLPASKALLRPNGCYL
jgi:hypothetical protein